MAKFIEKDENIKHKTWQVKGRTGSVIGKIRFKENYSYPDGFGFVANSTLIGISEDTLEEIVDFIREKDALL